MDGWLREHLVCPRDRQPLELESERLRCPHGHEYPYVDGIPVFLVEEAERIPPDLPRELEVPAVRTVGEGEVDPFVQKAVMATNGILYRSRIGRLPRYPIPEIRLPPGRGERLLDMGCNWGRWCVAAARRGYRPVGVDHNFLAVHAARRVARQLGVEAHFLVADARFLPFADASFEVGFSYSVFQHLSVEDAEAAIAELGRVLRPGGSSLVQLANRWGARSLAHQARRGFRDPVAMEVRYWTPARMRRAFEARVGPSSLSVDGYFGLGIQKSDVDLIPPAYRPVIAASEGLRALSRRLPALASLADSLYVHSRKRAPARA